MRKGRGLIDQDVYDELMKIPGCRAKLLANTCNHRFDEKKQKTRVEISEEGWPEIKAMAANFARAKAGKPQVKYTGPPAPT